MKQMAVEYYTKPCPIEPQCTRYNLSITLYTLTNLGEIEARYPEDRRLVSVQPILE